MDALDKSAIDFYNAQINIGIAYLQSGQNSFIRKAWEEKIAYLRSELKQLEKKDSV
jgi:hypothetical protein